MPPATPNDDEGDRGRDDRRDDAACRDQPDRLPVAVAGLAHHRQEDRRQRRGVGGRGSRQARHQDGRDDRDVAEAAAQVAHELDRQVDDASRDAARVHQLARKNEERDRQELVAVGTVDQVLRHDLGVEQPEHEHQREAGGEQRKGDGDPHRNGDEERGGEEEDAHAASFPAAPRIRRHPLRMVRPAMQIPKGTPAK